MPKQNSPTPYNHLSYATEICHLNILQVGVDSISQIKVACSAY